MAYYSEANELSLVIRQSPQLMVADEMLSLLNIPVSQAAIACTLILAISYFGFRVVRNLRPSTCKADTNATDRMRDFEEMRSEGGIDDTEFRLIETVLGKAQSKR